MEVSGHDTVSAQVSAIDTNDTIGKLCPLNMFKNL